MEHKWMKRFMALLLTVTLSVQFVSPAFGAVVQEQNGNITIVDADGNVVDSKSQAEWEEAYPYGVFAFRETQVNLKEGATDGAEKGTLTLYRLGGTEGRAEAVVVLVPAAAQIEEDRISYANAAGTKDYQVSVEDPWPIAQYQALGGTGEIIRVGGAITTLTETGESSEEDPDVQNVITQTFVAPVKDADSYQWQMQIKLYNSYVQRWSDIKDATDAEMVMSPELLHLVLDENYTYDFRCFYEVNGVKYCSESWKGEVYEPEVDDIPPIMPEDFVDDHTRTDSIIKFDGDEYDSYPFLVVFADGEWEKEITLEALDDDLHECAEVVNAIVVEARGAEVYSSACTASIAIEDDEEELPSAMGFAETEIWADKAAGTVRIPLTRESEGLQYVTGVDYTTENDTAIAGVDYAVSSGTAIFPSDLDYTYIEISLVNDGIPLKQEDSELSFTVKLTAAKGGGGSTLLEGKDTITVYLYNSCESTGDVNLATALYSPDEEDLTGAVGNTSAIVPAGGSVTASYVSPGENIQGEYIADGLLDSADSGISTYTYTYPGALSFGIAHGGKSWWTDNAALASEDVSNYSGAKIPVESDDIEGYVANAKSMWSGGYRYGSTGWALATERGGNMSMELTNLRDRYSSVTINANSCSDSSAGGYGGDDRSNVLFSPAAGDQYTEINSRPGDNVWQFYANTFGLGNTNKLEFRQHYTGSWPQGDARCTVQLLNGFLTRRTINLPIVRIFTADDDYLQAYAADLHNSIKPKIELIQGKGGTTDDGSKLYNNSQVQVSRNDVASAYTFASQANGGLNNKSLFFSSEIPSNIYLDEDDEITSNIPVSGPGTLTLLMSAKDASKKQGYINVVMDREQNFSLEISPSVPRISEDDNTTIDPAQIDATWQDIWEKALRNNPPLNENDMTYGITYEYREVTWDFSDGNDGFSDEKIGMLTQDMFSNEDNGSLYETKIKLKNIRSINFHLDEDDLILINGIAYAGNEDIPIPANLFLDDNITFYYYDADYVTGENTMVATISRIERYIDLNDDGVVNGTIDPTTGAFVPADDEYEYSEDTNTGTYYVLPSLTNENYTITQLAPRLGADGKYHQIVLKVYYSMLPRCLVVPAGASSEDTAEVIPAVVTAVTSNSVRNTMSDEQLGYRYINHNGTGSGKLMYQAKASVISFVDIPLGGDFNPATIDEDTKIITWAPEWRGNPYPGTEFTDPQPIYLDGTALGDHYPVGEVTTDGQLTNIGKERVANYLSSMGENDTFTLCVRETPESSTYGLRSVPEEYLTGVESSRLGNVSSYSATYSARDVSDPSLLKSAGFNSANANSPMSEYNADGEINLPEIELGITDFVSISTNGLELAISIGLNLFGVGAESDLEKQDKTTFQEKELNSPLGGDNAEAFDKIKRAIRTIKGADDEKTFSKPWNEDVAKRYKAKEKAHDADAFITSKGLKFGLGLNVTILLKWDSIENRFFFNQLLAIFTISLEYSYTVYLTPCPIFYCCVTFGFELEIATGLEASRVKVMGDNFNLTNTYSGLSGKWSYYKDQEHMGYDELDEPEENDFLVGKPGDSFTFTTKEKAVDVHFSGTLYVEAVGDQPEGFSPGTIRSAGDEAVTVKLAKKVDGKDNSKAYTLKFTVVNDDKTRSYNTANGEYKPLGTGYAIVDRIVEIDRQTHDVYFAGLSFSPELSMEVALGAGIDLLKIELFLNISIGCSFAIMGHDSEDYYGEEAENHPFVFNEFSFAAGLGFRVVAFLFSFEFNAIQFTITYDREVKYDEDTNKKNGWNFMWYAANQQIKSYDLRDGGDDNILKVNIILPGELYRDEAIFSPEDNMDFGITPFAFNPSDNTVPFQYSGYGSTGDAFTLGSGLVSGSTYELVTAGGSNYIVYTVTDQDQDSINQSRVALSKVQETAIPDENGQLTSDTVYGLVHPTDSNAETPYLVLDDDANGDLDFDAWVDDNGDIRVVWVSYTNEAMDAYEKALSTGDAIDAMEAAGRNTEVKTVTVDVGTDGTGKGAVKTVSDNAKNHGMYYMPSGAGDMIFYAEACYYTNKQLTDLLDGYKAYFGETNYDKTSSGLYYGEDDPTADYQMSMKRMRAQVYGKSFYPTFAVLDSTDSYTVSKVTAQDWIRSGVQIENASLAQVGSDYYAAYTTTQSALINNNTDDQTIKKLYLQKLTIGTEGDDAGKAVPGSAVALRKLVDNAKDNSVDGVYTSASLSEEYRDPYLANLQFLTGKLGSLVGEEENFTEQIQMQSYSLRSAAETFLIFEMNGNTYVVPNESLESITGTSRKGSIIPFFTRETIEKLNNDEYVSSNEANMPVAANVTFGADGNGNITAVYTRGENGAPGNALYLTKYDPQSQTWGLGTRLAMRDLDTIEEAEANGWDAKETAAVWYEKLNSDDEPSSFTFNRLRVGLAGEDKLLIVAEGTLMALEATQQQQATYDSKGTLTGLAPVTDENGEPVYNFQAKQTNGAYETKNGVYALSFGMGNQDIGSASLYLSNYDLTPGSTMNASVSFVNSGDVAIRASENNPATITMYAGEEKVAEWQITENIRAGQKVNTESALITMPGGLKIGDKIYFTVSEDLSYIDEGNAFTQTTKTAEGAEDTAACITVAEHVELGYEDFDITMVGADEDTVTLATDIHVGNRGSATSDMTYLRFQYEKVNSKGEIELYPVNLTGHKLSVSEESPISRFARDARTLANGYLLLRTTQDGVEVDDAYPGRIQSMYGRTVTGTFTVPKNFYDTNYGTGSLNLRVTIESYNDSGDENTEYNAANNVKFYSVEPETLFTTVNSVNMQVGSTLRLPLTMQTSTKTEPTVTVTEITDDDSRNLSVLYYDVNQSSIVVIPANFGEGKIRVADTATNSFHDICYKIEGEGASLNIYDDNGIFTWYDASGNAGDAGHDAWAFRKALLWSDDLQITPLRSDLAIGYNGDSFSFQTLADSINLYFMGTDTTTPVEIEVTSNLSGFGTNTYTSADGTVPVAIKFGNSECIAHTVTITVKSSEIRFDKMEEIFSGSLNIKTDPTAPGIYWSRTLPKAASVKQGESMNLTAYFVDLGGLVSVTMNGADVSNQLIKDGEELWALPLTITENGSYRFVVTDKAGNTTTRDLSVDWFSATLQESTDPGAPDITAQFTQEDGTPIPAIVPGDMQVMLKVTDSSGNATEATISQYQYDDPESPTSQNFVPCEDMEPNEDTLYPVLRGIYRVAVSDENTGVTSYRFVNLDERDSNAPVVTLSKNADGTALVYTAEKYAGGDSNEITQINSIKLNDLELLETDERGYRFSGVYAVTHGGSYVLTATDENGNKGVSGEVKIDPLPIVLPESAISITKVTEISSTDEKGQPVYTSNVDGMITIDLDQITGGVYDSEASMAAGRVAGSYEFALLPVIDNDVPTPDEDTEWKKADQLTGLDAGDYALYIRDINAPDVITGPIYLSVEFLRVIIQDVKTTPAPNGSITVTATGGIGTLEYAIYSLDLEKSGRLTINDQGTPNDDSDDTVDTIQPDDSVVSRILWQNTNTLTELPSGNYMVKVRDSNNHSNCAEQEVHVSIKSFISTSFLGFDFNSVTVLEQPENGTISVNPSKASVGQTVVITITPDEGYGVKSVTVMDKNGKNIPVTSLGDGKYSFIMPVTAVTIEVTLVPLNSIVTFTDVPANAYYADAVSWAVSQGVTNGTSETTFSPNVSCTRAQAVTFLWRAAGSPEPAATRNPFTDVESDGYYYKAVLWAMEQGITVGTTDTTFSPNAVCTRAQIVTFLWRSQECPAAGTVNPFTDVADNAYYAEAVKWAVMEGVTSGTTAATFSPNDNCTRAQIVTFLWRLFGE